MVRMKLPLFLYLSLSLGGSRALFAASQTEKVVIGTVASVSDAGIYVGIAKGFFKEFGLQLEPGVSDSGSKWLYLRQERSMSPAAPLRPDYSRLQPGRQYQNRRRQRHSHARPRLHRISGAKSLERTSQKDRRSKKTEQREIRHQCHRRQRR